MYTKILMQIVLLAYFLENTSLLLHAAQVKIPQQLVKNTAKDIESRQNEIINSQSTVTNPVASTQTTAQTQPANQKIQTVSSIKNDSKIKNKPESMSAVTTPENVKKEDDSQIPTPGSPSLIGLINNNDLHQNNEFEEDEEMEDDEDGENNEENHIADYPTQSKPILSKLSSSTTTKPEGVNNEGEEEEEEEEIEYDDDDDDDDEEIAEEEEKTTKQQPTSLKKNQIDSFKKNTNQQPFYSLSIHGTNEDREYYGNEDSEEHWENNHQTEAYSWPLSYQKEYNGLQQQELSPSSNTLNKRNSQEYEYQEDDEGHYNVESEQQLNKQEQLSSAFNANNELTNYYETPNYITDNNYGKSIHNNEFEPQQYTNRQTNSYEEMESEESNINVDSSNTQFSDEEKILNGYKTIKKILYMLHDYASSTFNWIIKKINSQIEKVELNQKNNIS